MLEDFKTDTIPSYFEHFIYLKHIFSKLPYISRQTITGHIFDMICFAMHNINFA